MQGGARVTRLKKRWEASPLTQPHQLMLVTPNMSRDKKELATIIKKRSETIMQWCVRKEERRKPSVWGRSKLHSDMLSHIKGQWWQKSEIHCHQGHEWRSGRHCSHHSGIKNLLEAWGTRPRPAGVHRPLPIKPIVMQTTWMPPHAAWSN